MGSGGVQRLMPRRYNPYHRGRASAQYKIVTIGAWARILWSMFGHTDVANGLVWNIGFPSSNHHNSHMALLHRLDEFLLALSHQSAVVLAFIHSKHAEFSYDELRKAGRRRTSSLQTVFLLHCGARGYNGHADKDMTLFNAIVACFSKHLGAERVATVGLCNKGSFPRLTPASVVSYLKIEYATGGLAEAVAGLLFKKSP